MSNKDIEQIALQDMQFKRALNSARRALEQDNPVGKKIDSYLTPIFKKYAFYDFPVRSAAVIPNKIPAKEFAFLDKKTDMILNDFGIDVSSLLGYLKSDIWPATEKQMHLRNMYLKAEDAIKYVKNHIHPGHVPFGGSGVILSDIYGIINKVVKLYKEIEKYKDDGLIPANDNVKQAVTEALKSLLYYKPNKVIDNIKEVSNNTAYSEEFVIESFKEVTGVYPEEYNKLLLAEAAGDYMKYGLSNIVNKTKGMLLPGQSGKLAQEKVKTNKEMNILLNKWISTIQGDYTLSTATNLKNFLVNTAKYDPKAVNSLIRKWRSEFSANKINNKQGYLTSNRLRDFFYNAVVADKQSFAHNQGNAPLSVTPKKLAKSVQQQVAGRKPASGMTASPQLVQNLKTRRVTTNRQQPTVDPVQQILSVSQQLSTNEQAKLILQMLPNLSTKDLDSIIANLVNQKRKNP